MSGQHRGKKQMWWIEMLIAFAIGAGGIGCGGGSSTATPTPTPMPNPVPGIAGIVPNGVPAGALAFTLNVHGSNFMPDSVVEWNGSSRTTTFVSTSLLQANIKAADLAAPGKIALTVINPPPGGGSSNAGTFTVALDTIAFESNRALDGSDAANANNNLDIWTMNSDGSSQIPLTKLTALGAVCLTLKWSADGSKIAFSSSGALDGSNAVNSNSTLNIWTMNSDGSSQAPLTRLTASGANSFDPKPSPDGSKIAFVSSRALDGSDAVNANHTFNVWMMSADGTGARALTKLTASGAGSFPISPNPWSPDGTRVLFVSSGALDGSDAANANRTSNVWAMGADGTGATPLTKLTANGAGILSAGWSPDGNKIVFASSRSLDGSDATNTNFTGNIWLMTADGSNATSLTRLTASGANSFLPIWSPDGSKIAFSSSRAVNGSDSANTNFTENVWIMNADGSGAAPLSNFTAAGANSNARAWSPDGVKIFFASARALDGSNTANPGGNNNIWVMNADGFVTTPLTKLAAANNDFPNQP